MNFLFWNLNKKPLEDLWPEDIDVTDELPPVSILKEQAALLGQRTKNLVEGRVRGGISDYARTQFHYRGSDYPRTQFHYTFELVAPALENYRYELFSISHDVDIYPLIVEWDSPDNAMLSQVAGERGIENEEQFIGALEIIFSSDRTRKVISSLISQSRAAS